MNFHGGLLSSILDLLSRIFKDDMRSELEGVVSKHGISILFCTCVKCSIKVLLSGVIGFIFGLSLYFYSYFV